MEEKTKQALIINKVITKFTNRITGERFFELKNENEKILIELKENLTKEVLEFTEKTAKPGIKGEKGEKGDSGYTPKKGKDYFTIIELNEIKKSITPKKGIDYYDGVDGLPAANDDAKTIVQKIASLAGDDRLHINSLRGVTQLIGKNGKGEIMLVNAPTFIPTYPSGLFFGLTNNLFSINSGSSGQVLTMAGTTFIFSTPTGSGGGGISGIGATNFGSTGIGVLNNITGANLQFNNINSLSSRITLAQGASATIDLNFGSSGLIGVSNNYVLRSGDSMTDNLNITGSSSWQLFLGMSLNASRGIVLRNANTTTNNSIDFDFEVSATDTVHSRIRHHRTDNVSSTDSDLAFFTMNGISGSNFTGGLVERMRIKHNGYIGIGTTSRLGIFTVAGNTFLTGVGTISGNSGTNKIGGVGTNFLHELAPGSRMIIAGQTIYVASIESGTSLTLDVTPTNLTSTVAGTSFIYKNPVNILTDIGGNPFQTSWDSGEVVINAGTSINTPLAPGIPLTLVSSSSALITTVLALRNPNGGVNSGSRIVFTSSPTPQAAQVANISAYRTNTPATFDGDLGFITAGFGVATEKIRIKSTGNIGFGIGLSNPLSLIHFNSGSSSGGMRVGTRRITATGNINIFDYYIGVSAGASITLTLPVGASVIDSIFKLVDESGAAATNTITILTQAGELINGTSQKLISTNFGALEILGNSGRFFIT